MVRKLDTGTSQPWPTEEVIERLRHTERVAHGKRGLVHESEEPGREGIKETIRQILDENERLRSRVKELEAARRKEVRGKGKNRGKVHEGKRSRHGSGNDPRMSVRYRIGDVLVNAASRPGRDTLAAPVRLWRLLREGLRNRRARGRGR